MLTRMLFCVFILLLSLNGYALTAKEAHEIVKQREPALLGAPSELVSIYYFGAYRELSVVGLERISDEFLPIRWLLLFNGKQLMGWYHPLKEFPSSVEGEYLKFPKGLNVPPVKIVLTPPSEIKIGNQLAQYITPSMTAPSVLSSPSNLIELSEDLEAESRSVPEVVPLSVQ